MCGIFGLIAKTNTGYTNHNLIKVLNDLACLSQIRGKDSSGIAFKNNHQKEITVFKGAVPVSVLIKGKIYKEAIHSAFEANENTLLAFGHSRLVTNGTQLDDFNNQPVVKGDIIAIHNGIIVNVEQLWQSHSELKREYDIDTEILLSLIQGKLTAQHNTVSAFNKAMEEVYGTVSTAIYIDRSKELLLATNNGSLYILSNNDDLLIFGSEKYILKQLIKNHTFLSTDKFKITQVLPGNGYLIDVSDFKIKEFGQDKPLEYMKETNPVEKFKIAVNSINHRKLQNHAVVDLKSIRINPHYKHEESLLEYNHCAISQLKRCSRCLLPETFPFIEYDNSGVCNYCNNYKIKNHPRPIEELKSMVEPYRRKCAEDVIVPFSGGRDSSFLLHKVKTELGLNPIAYTYDWGMVTDLARRNIARICGKLGVENIIVAADIQKKRRNIRNNISAWLKRPELGMIPLFMAGDKYFFYYCSQLQKQTGIKLNIWGVNNLENTDFKTGFAGLKPNFNKDRIYSLSMNNQAKLFGFVAKNLILDPAYINSSVIDTLGSFAARYINPKKDYYHFYDYYRWDEKEIEDTIINEYDWETSGDTKSTWRIGDGTASFYNYVYYTVAGFSENETFRSNMIREGMITREEALKLSEEENRPRYESLKWYLEVLGLDFENVIKRINKIPKLYKM